MIKFPYNLGLIPSGATFTMTGLQASLATGRLVRAICRTLDLDSLGVQLWCIDLEGLCNVRFLSCDVFATLGLKGVGVVERILASTVLNTNKQVP